MHTSLVSDEFQSKEYGACTTQGPPKEQRTVIVMIMFPSMSDMPTVQHHTPSQPSHRHEEQTEYSGSTERLPPPTQRPEQKRR